jgi:hypothetical protein
VTHSEAIWHTAPNGRTAPYEGLLHLIHTNNLVINTKATH